LTISFHEAAKIEVNVINLFSCGRCQRAINICYLFPSPHCTTAKKSPISSHHNPKNSTCFDAMSNAWMPRTQTEHQNCTRQVITLSMNFSYHKSCKVSYKCNCPTNFPIHVAFMLNKDGVFGTPSCCCGHPKSHKSVCATTYHFLTSSCQWHFQKNQLELLTKFLTWHDKNWLERKKSWSVFCSIKFC